MKNILIFVVFLVGIAPSVFAGGGEVTNGGDSVLCRKDPSNPFEGYFALDYMMTLRRDNSDLVSFPSWAQYRDRLTQIFANAYGDLGYFWQNFLVDLPDSVHPGDLPPTRKRIWEEAIYGLVDIKDERMIRKLPPNCVKSGADSDSISVIQTVVRQQLDFSTIYQYDPDILFELEKTNPLQYSFIIVHEWLRDFTNDPEVIRRINRFLHTQSIDRLGKEEFRLSLMNLGLSTRVPFRPICQRTEQVRKAIEETSGLPCQLINEEAVSKLNTPPNLQSRGITEILPGDLSGLALTNIYLKNNAITHLFEDSFFGVYFLNNLDLSQNRIQEVPVNLFGLLRQDAFAQIDFSGNLLKTFDFDLFKTIQNIEYLNLSGNALEQIRIRNLKKIKYANFSGNQISTISIDEPTEIENVNLSGNRLRSLDSSGFLQNLKAINYLDLSNNQIENLDLSNMSIDQFQTQVENRDGATIDLTNNKISTLRTSSLNQLLCVYKDFHVFSPTFEVIFTGNPEVKIVVDSPACNAYYDVNFRGLRISKEARKQLCNHFGRTRDQGWERCVPEPWLGGSFYFDR